MLFPQAVGYLHLSFKFCFLQIAKAEGVLIEIKRILTSGKDKNPSIFKLSKEFYNHLPHDPAHQDPIDSKSFLARKQDLCQLVKDMVSVSEATDWNVRASVESKYRALRCHMSDVDRESDQYSGVMDLLRADNNR